MDNNEESQDMFDLDELNSKFVAAAMERQEESPFCDVDMSSFEEDLGDLIL